ncbi:cytochrome c oxidase accessory protein CcoG [Pacificimonas sp. WHA3]|uniref:Cytochrome c oxidase accessory protein CcoG n=1 Tax=Pacificimonas pallii TaxID=2827236 RepID=A0ABS6SHA3_9SPHN|nr:cytochrome c oxidase accessory protein CcoG [Pacificimonas pallii]MBV7257418.1 cytochrome c oxidase accessory protein CcoG [Pacificimonas pallii]
MNAPDTLDEPPLQLYEKRKSVFPQAVDGTFRRLKWAIMAVTLAIYYVTPWIRWDRGPYAPDQAVLVDLANRRFYMFGIEIWPQEFYYIVGLLVMAGIGLFLVTSAVGRAWCGYACPQTVWTDLFQHVERFVDGDRNAQIRLQRAPWGPGKIARRLFKWSIWLVIAFATGGAWIFYFADAPTLAQDFLTGNAAFVAYATVGVLTATTFIFGGFLREQVCIYMCPWPRIQSAMLDENSLIVTYKEWRGEPRAKGLKKARGPDEPFGDCIDCMKCVSVCPTGIDIREGPQIGCITCALCIDACDKVMDQIGRPRGLIDYATLEGQEREREGKPALSPLKTLLRPRTLLYFGIWAGIGLAMLFTLGTRSRIDIAAAHDRNPPYVQMSDGTVRNDFTLKVSNMQARPRQMEIGLVGLDDAVMWRRGGSRDIAGRTLTVDLPADSVKPVKVFVVGPDSALGRRDFAFSVRALDEEGGADSVKVHFAGPGDGS